MKLDFEVLLSVDFDKTIVNYRLITLHNWSHKVAHHLETNWRSIFNLDVEVRHALTSFSGLHNYTELDFFFTCFNDAVDDATFCCAQTFTLGLDVYFKGVPILAFETELVTHLAFASLL